MPIDLNNENVILVDTAEVPMAVGDGSILPAGTKALVVAGMGATRTYFIAVDSSGRQMVIGAAADGAAVAGNPVLVAGSDGTNAQTLLTDSSGRLVIASDIEEATFNILATNVAIGTNKSMISVLNATGSTVKLKIYEIWIRNVQTTAVTGVVALFELHRFTAATAAHSGGTVVTPASMDTADTINASVTARTGATTITTEVAAVVNRWLWSSDQWGTGTLDQEGMEHTMQNLLAGYARGPKMKPFTLNANEGLTIKQITASTAGTFDILLVAGQV